MKNKIKKIGIVIFICIIIILAIICLLLKYKKSKTEEVVSNNIVTEDMIQKTVEWHAQYIWDSENEKNSWMCFRKKINLEKNQIKDIVAQIAVDSKYWLYINNEIVIREGELKRGEKINSTYYDEVDLTKYFVEGENTIAILVWYWGDESMSHIDSGKGTMLFQTKIGDEYLISDDTWKVIKNPAYLQDDLRPNNRLVEYNVFYDATLEVKDWYSKNFDDTNWKNATVLGNAGDAPWGELIKRNIPQFKNYKKKEYENIKEYKDYITQKREILEMELPYNMQCMPYLKIEAPEGLTIEIKTDTYEDINGDSIRCIYKTKSGLQEFEMLPWLNGEKVYYIIPEGVKIISLGYRQTSYDSEQTGDFKSNDEFLNKLWENSSRTLLLNMRDSYMDCPNRERAQWVGDMNIEMIEAQYALDTNANALYRKGIKSILGTNQWGILFTIAPSDYTPMNLPLQSISLINSVYEYYKYTGDKELLEEFYPYIKEYLDLWYKSEDGLYKCGMTYYVWEWGDSSEGVDYKTLENGWYGLSLLRTSQIAEILNNEEDKVKYREMYNELKESFNNLWTEDGFKSEKSESVDGRANALAVLAGFVNQDKIPIVRKLLSEDYNASPYMEYYILDAMSQMEDIENAQKRIKDKYEEMINGENACSTLWENWVFENRNKKSCMVRRSTCYNVKIFCWNCS